MADVDFLDPNAEEMILATHSKVLSRATGATGVVNGNKITAGTGMQVLVDAGRIRIAGLPIDIPSGDVTLGNADPTLDRIDLIIRDTDGSVSKIAGTANIIQDGKGLGNWHQYILPAPNDTIGDVAVLGAVHVRAGMTQILTADIWMFAGKVPDIATTIGSPGVDSRPISEKSIRSQIGAALGLATLNTSSKVVQDPANINTILACAPNYYERSRMWKNKGSDSAANRRTLVSPDKLLVNINSIGYALVSAVELDLVVAGSWDTQTPTDYAVAANRAGKDFYIYACVPVSGSIPVILLSANSTYPSGYSAITSRKIGSFHCECVAVGAIGGHALTGYLAGDIIPRSIQDLKHRPRQGFMPGMVWAGYADFDALNGPQIWVQIYLTSGTAANTTSAYLGTISDTRTWLDFVDDGAAIGCRLLWDHEFQTIATGSNEETNIVGSADPGTTGGHSDTAGRRMISNIGCEDCCGTLWQWLQDQSFRPPASAGWGWYDLPRSKGSLYNNGGAGGDADVKLVAGGDWAAGSDCGSRSRGAIYFRWDARSPVGGRLAAEPA